MVEDGEYFYGIVRESLYEEEFELLKNTHPRVSEIDDDADRKVGRLYSEFPIAFTSGAGVELRVYKTDEPDDPNLPTIEILFRYVEVKVGEIHFLSIRVVPDETQEE